MRAHCPSRVILAGCAKSDNAYLQSYLSDWSDSLVMFQTSCPPNNHSGTCQMCWMIRHLWNRVWFPHTTGHRFFVASSPHSGDWLFALPIASCGLRLDDEAVRVAVGLRLWLNLCVPHQCHCNSEVDACGIHSLVCKKAPGRSARHHALNDLVARGFSSAGVRVTKELVGLFRTDG